jgi:hypothetical protein
VTKHEHEHDYAGIDLRPIGLPADLEPDHHQEESRESLLALRVSDVITDHHRLISLLGLLLAQQSSPWAVIVVAFNDDPSPSTDLTPYRKVFTSDGAGTMNVVDYFADVSHGLLDLSGTRVFGPYVVDRPRADYVGNVYPQPAGKLNRNGILDLAKATAVAAGVDLTPYVGVVVCGTPLLDLCGWVGGGAALCDDNSLQPSLLGQEMGHGYGLDHSRLDGSDADYQDAWDTMSTANAFMAMHPSYGSVGPGLNAANMKLRGWLSRSRVLSVPDNAGSEQVVTLRPLHARHLPGHLAVDVGGYLVEFRVRSRWDAGIPRACVLVHRTQGNISYLMKAADGHPDLVAGEEFSRGIPSGVFGQHVRVHVESIDETNERATVRIAYAPMWIPHIPELGGMVLGGMTVDGGGLLVVNGKVIKVPPRGPDRALVEAMASYLEAGTSPQARLAGLHALLREVGETGRSIEVVSHTPPGLERVPKSPIAPH